MQFARGGSAGAVDEEDRCRKGTPGSGELCAESFRLGYSIHLRKAWRKLDPGTRQASFYGSEIDLEPSPTLLANYPGKQPRKYENLLVTLNAPWTLSIQRPPGGPTACSSRP